MYTLYPRDGQYYVRINQVEKALTGDEYADLQSQLLVPSLVNGDIILHINSVKALEICRKNRMSEYPEIGEQLDLIYKDQLNGTSLWQDKITEIKNKYPKPE